jgi:hypothetical protein
MKLFFIGKVIDRVYGSRDHDCLSVHGGLTTMGRRGCSGAREVVVIAQKERERERRLSRFSPMTSLGAEAAEMVTRQCSTKASSGAPMRRWFRVREGEIGAGVGAVDNGGALVAPFIGS